MESECLEVQIPVEQIDSEKKRKTSITILEMEGVSVTRDAMSFLVTGGEIKNRISYMSTFEGAMQEVSDRLFLGKLNRRAEEGRVDFESLVKLIEGHRDEMKEKFKL